MKARKEIRATVRIALSVAFLCVSAMIAVPFFPVPFTLQSFAVLLVISLLGSKDGGIALVLYLALGAIGLPVFSSFGGGIGVLLGPTGGFLFGFLGAPFVFVLCRRMIRKERLSLLLAMIGSLLLLYLCGTLWYYYLFAAGASLWAVLSLTVLPFLLPDAIKLFLVLLVNGRMKKHPAFSHSKSTKTR